MGKSNKWLSELWRYRELVYFFAWRDVKVRYKQAVLGAAWVILQPLSTMIVFTVLFGRLAGMPSDGLPYPIFCYCGLVFWTYFSSVLNQAGQSLVANSNLVTKIYFPRLALPASSAISSLVELCISLLFLIFMMIYYGIEPGWSLLLAPFFLVALIVLAVGTGLFLAALNVCYRDVKHAIPFLIQIGFFVTPIIYPLSLVSENFRFLMALNPMTGIVEGFRACLFPERPLDPMLTGLSLTVTVLLFLAGLVFFRKTERVFADVI